MDFGHFGAEIAGVSGRQRRRRHAQALQCSRQWGLCQYGASAGGNSMRGGAAVCGRVHLHACDPSSSRGGSTTQLAVWMPGQPLLPAAGRGLEMLSAAYPAAAGAPWPANGTPRRSAQRQARAQPPSGGLWRRPALILLGRQRVAPPQAATRRQLSPPRPRSNPLLTARRPCLTWRPPTRSSRATCGTSGLPAPTRSTSPPPARPS